jgi:hypothetical protein
MEWLAILTAPVGQALIRWPTLYIFLNASHILSLAMLIGASVILDLRLLGGVSRLPLADTAAVLSRIAALALGTTMLTGVLLFSVRPLEYVENTAFLIKIGLVLLGTLNALAVRASRHWAALLAGARPAPQLRLAASVSLAIWLAALLAGRWIGFL